MIGNLPECAPVTAVGWDGARISACAHGGHLLSWQPAVSGQGVAPGSAGPELLWLSPLARCGPGEAIRGGVPVIFPQFAARGPLPKHGLARDRAWVLTAGQDGDLPRGSEASEPAERTEGPPVRPTAVLEARLTDDTATRAIWPHAFELSLRMTASGSHLALRLQVMNIGQEAFTFTAALHAYLAADSAAALLGLEDATAEDNAAGLAEVTLPADPLPATAGRDLAVRNLPGEVHLAGASGTTTLRRSGFADLVVWNPGPAHGLTDLPPGPAGFVCLEPAQLTPVTLVPTQTWTASAAFVHRAPGDHGEGGR